MDDLFDSYRSRLLRGVHSLQCGFGQAEGLVDLAGLLQRVAVTVGFGWLTLLAVHLLRASTEVSRKMPI